MDGYEGINDSLEQPSALREVPNKTGIAAPATPEPVEDVEAWADEWLITHPGKCRVGFGLSRDGLNAMLRDFAAAQRGKPKPESL